MLHLHVHLYVYIQKINLIFIILFLFSGVGTPKNYKSLSMNANILIYDIHVLSSTIKCIKDFVV